ncbi:hypothetical protein FRC02_011700 [Tulasnella sp. 418]|nr:hypothetical protein FRC02_011700 [Tulasnella sp. 418]
MRELPPELYIHIIEAVGLPPNPNSFLTRHTPTLASLSRVNRVFHEWSNSVLYSRVSITSSNLLKFRRSIVADSSEPETDQDSTHRPYVPTALGRLVKSLAIIRFEDLLTLSEIRNIALIFYALSDSLERLVFDVWLRPIDYRAHLLEAKGADLSLRAAIRGLSNIREFCSTEHFPRSFDPMPWASTPTMESLAMFRVDLHHKLADTAASFKQLKRFGIGFPSLAGTQVAGSPLEVIFDIANPKFQELMFVTTSDDKTYLNGFQKLLGEVMESGYIRQSGGGEKLSVATVEGTGLPAHLDSNQGQEKWYVDAILEGTFWDLERKSWDEFLKSMRTDGN